MQSATNLAIDLTEQLAAGTLTPVFDGSAPVATYEDAVALDQVVQLGLDDLDRFDPADQAILTDFAALVAALVADGEANFDAGDIGPLLAGAAQVVNLLTSGECDGFLQP